MKALILTVLVSFAATAAFAQEFKTENYKEESVSLDAALAKKAKEAGKSEAEFKADLLKNIDKMTMNLVKEKLSVKPIDYSNFTAGDIKIKNPLYEGKIVKVNFIKNIKLYGEKETYKLAYYHSNTKDFDYVDVALSADEKDLANQDPHHLVPVYAYIKIVKGKEVLETGKVNVFDVELFEIWGAERAKTQDDRRYENNYINGDPHANENYTSAAEAAARVGAVGAAAAAKAARSASKDPHYNEDFSAVEAGAIVGAAAVSAVKEAHTVIGDPHYNEKF